MSLNVSLLLTIVISLCQAQNQTNYQIRQRHPDVGLNVVELLTKYGYPFENHTISTEDGYILELHRIPYGRNGNTKEQQRVPVLLMPGMLCGSTEFVNMGPEKSLGLILADKGYDVWLGNYRGTTWSRKHTKLNPDVDRKEYWSYSFHEIGYYDLKAFIDYVLYKTEQEKLHFIGHSQGTTSYFVLMSERPEYNDKIRLASFLAPVAFADNMRSPLIALIEINHEKMENITNTYNFYEILPHNEKYTIAGQYFCNDDAPTQIFCAGLLYFIAGFSPRQLNKTMIPIISSNAPAGSSIFQYLHYGQLASSNNFQQYDYGELENQARYGQPHPPAYDLTKINSTAAFFYGTRDLFSVKKDVERLAALLPNLVMKKRIRGFSHIDVLWGKDVVEKIFNDILKLMSEY